MYIYRRLYELSYTRLYMYTGYTFTPPVYAYRLHLRMSTRIRAAYIYICTHSVYIYIQAVVELFYTRYIEAVYRLYIYTHSLAVYRLYIYTHSLRYAYRRL